MPCFRPLAAWRKAERNPSGKRGITFRQSESNLIPIQLPCGQCIGCRLERSRQWAIRCVHEAQLHKENCFVTLTYDDSHLPDGGTLVVRDFQLFMKRLRKAIGDARVRFFHCGEYGEQMDRPHYHACLFGYDFPDRELWSIRDEVKLYRSAMLEKLWTVGFSTVGDVTFESAAYVARYITKKVTGKGIEIEPGRVISPEEWYGGRKPEYVTMSRRPGIGANWYKKYARDVYPADSVVVRGGVKCRPPRFYDKLLEMDAPALLREIKFSRVRLSANSADCTPRRLRDRGEVREALVRSTLRRGYENGV